MFILNFFEDYSFAFMLVIQHVFNQRIVKFLTNLIWSMIIRSYEFRLHSFSSKFRYSFLKNVKSGPFNKSLLPIRFNKKNNYSNYIANNSFFLNRFGSKIPFSSSSFPFYLSFVSTFSKTCSLKMISSSSIGLSIKFDRSFLYVSFLFCSIL